ncbi:hypothetical protein K0M31_013914 [Melipona bicolor]|uniref:Doublesex dimerisation domain-containing protein n=1 Tax=Melipona bicolor TaxID=60889 RepID=A0AA40G8P3_9HYME|nr:hypothetical protein K0M31_013914 [Melipona bicolor]
MFGDVDGCGVTEFGMFAHLGGFKKVYRIRRILEGESVELLLEHSTKLVELFQYPWEAILLMYINLKYAGANPEEVVRRMVDASIVFCPKNFTWDSILRKILSFIVNLSPA